MIQILFEILKEIFFAYLTYIVIFLSQYPDSRHLVYKVLWYEKIGPIRKFNSFLFLVFNPRININTFYSRAGICIYIPAKKDRRGISSTIAADKDTNLIYKSGFKNDHFILNGNKIIELNIDRFFKTLGLMSAGGGNETGKCKGYETLVLEDFCDILEVYPEIKKWFIETEYVSMIPDKNLSYGWHTDRMLDLYLFLKYLTQK